MPSLKPHRGTVLVVGVIYPNPVNPPSVEYVIVFNLQIGGIRKAEFVMDDDSIVPFGRVVPSLTGVIAERAVIFGIYPDGTHIKTNDYHFSSTDELLWSEHRILAYHPKIDPDWRNNKYLVVVSR